MYLRLLAIIFVFDWRIGLQLLTPFIIIIFMSLLAIIGLLTVRNHVPELHDAGEVKHPLELTTATLFALLFMLFTFVTHYVTSHYGNQGLKSSGHYCRFH